MKLIAVSTASLIVCGYLCEVPRCFGQQTKPKSTVKRYLSVNPWNEIKREWEIQKAAFDWSKVGAKNVTSQQVTLLVGAIKHRHMGSSDTELVNSLKSVSDDGFRCMAIQALVATFTESGARLPLVEVLANWCPRKVFASDVEFWLAYQTRNTMKDGVAVLWEAYERSHDAGAKKEIADALRRGFLALGVVDSHDDGVVTKSRAWYEVHRIDWSPNLRYGDNTMHPRGNPGLRDPYATNGLFVRAARSETP